MQIINTLFYSLLIFSLASVEAKVADHLKKHSEQSECRTIRNIDYIYMINLDERPEKFAMSLKQLEPYGIVPSRFSAVNGWQLSFETINDVGVKYQPWMQSDHMGTCYLPENGGMPQHERVHVVGRNYFCHCMSRGAIGIFLSHLSILQDAYDAGYETIWVMEDDIEVIQDPRILSNLIDGLDRAVGKQGWDILFTDRDTKSQSGDYIPCKAAAWRPNFTPSNSERFAVDKSQGRHYRRIGARYGAYSMIVRRSGMKKLLKFFNKYQIFLPYDMDFVLPNDIKLFTVNEDVVSTITNALSDNGGPNYEKER